MEKDERSLPPMSLTNLDCKNASYDPFGNNKLADGGGLYLHVMPSNAKIWRQKYRFNGKENILTHGPYPLIPLAEAREKRDAAKKMLIAGTDPAALREKAREAKALVAATTFELVAREWHELRKDRWTPGHAQDILHRLEMDIFSEIGHLPISEIRPLQVLSALRLIEQRGAFEMARRSMQYCGQIFRYAVITERAERDVTIELKGALRPFKKGHYAALEPDDLPDFIKNLEGNDARLYQQTRHAIKLLMLTFVRTNELIGATWGEFNFAGAEWIIPQERMKMRRPHIVPLSKQALEILAEQKKMTGKWEWIFPNLIRPRDHMSNNTVLKALERMGYKGRMTGHGFRALAMTTIKEKLKYRHEVVDRQLAHAPANKVDAAYDRAKFLDERKEMMQQWADYLDKVAATGKVIHVDFAQAAE
jgi:integrase